MSADPQFVDVTYRGLKVASRAKLAVVDGVWFVEHDAPLPVGTRVIVVDRSDPSKDGEAGREARVTGVVEQEAGAKSSPGMRLEFADGARVPVAKPAEAVPVAIADQVTAPEQAAVPEPADSTRQTTVMMVPSIEDISSDGEADSSSPGDPDRSSPGGRRKKRRRPNGR